MNTSLHRVLKALGIVVVILVLCVVGLMVYILTTWDRPVARSLRELRAPTDAQTVARGKYLYNQSMLCWTCHGSNGGHDPAEPQSGGNEFDLSSIGPGFGMVWAPNLTSDRETGIGSATDAEIVRAIREGIDHRGKVIFPVMAYQFYHGLGDDDALALVAYLRTLAPIRNAVRPRELSFIAKALIAFRQIKPEPPVTEAVSVPPKGATVEYGEYLTWRASGCAECHTPRFPDNGKLDRTRLMGGGLFAFPEAGFTTTAPNLTPDVETGLGRWTEAQFVQAVRGGVKPNGTVILPFMPWPTYGDWSDEDVHAVWLYLRSLPAVSHTVPPSALRGAAAGASGRLRGEGLFGVYCVRCHGVGGRGGSVATIPLRDLARDLDEDTIRAFITEGPPGTRMPGFGKTLTSEQIADLIAFIRSW